MPPMTGPRARARPETAARAEGPRPALPVGVDMADHRERRGFRRCCPDAHNNSADDEHRHRRGDRTDDRAAAEDHDAHEHDPLAAEGVAQRTANEHEARERQSVTANDPLELAHARVQFRLDARQYGTGDCVVEKREEQYEQERGEAEVRAQSMGELLASFAQASGDGRTGDVFDHRVLGRPLLGATKPPGGPGDSVVSLTRSTSSWAMRK